ncbi:MAG: cysteine synthase family protein [Chloroflexi bacterium]|nr:cysteine synthase family protein [Chloroflexota bacterium]
MTESTEHGITESILDLIGNTPLLRLSRISAGTDARILAKLEFLNPSGSIKDRMALQMIADAEAQGRIRPGETTLVEASSGNTAQAVAFVSAVKGYQAKIRLPESTASPEKLKALQRFGAEIELMKAGEEEAEANRVARQAGLHGATIEIPGRVKCLKEERETPNIYWLRQFSNPANTEGQAEIGHELLKQTNNQIDLFITSVGTGGTFLGVSRVLKATLPKVKCIAVQPVGWKADQHPLSADAIYIPEITNGILKTIRDTGIADEIIAVPNEDAVAMAYRLSREEGLNVGISSGANAFVAWQKAQLPEIQGKTIVTIMVDSGYRYISAEKYVT